jgi:hypothetical protein
MDATSFYETLPSLYQSELHNTELLGKTLTMHIPIQGAQGSNLEQEVLYTVPGDCLRELWDVTDKLAN